MYSTKVSRKEGFSRSLSLYRFISSNSYNWSISAVPSFHVAMRALIVSQNITLNCILSWWFVYVCGFVDIFIHRRMRKLFSIWISVFSFPPFSLRNFHVFYHKNYSLRLLLVTNITLLLNIKVFWYYVLSLLCINITFNNINFKWNFTSTYIMCITV